MVRTLVKYIDLYVHFTKQSLKVMLEYRADFLIGMFSTIITQIAGILTVWIIFENVPAIKGWTFYQIAFLYGLMTISKSVAHIFFDELWGLGNRYIRTGSFDILLLRPINELFHLVANRLNQEGIGNLIIGLIIVVTSLLKLNIPVGIIEVLLLALFIVSGGLIVAAINLITSVISFWTVESISLMWSIFMMNEFAQYPITIYHRFIGIFLSWIIPFAFASFYPANYFLHKGYEHFSLLSPLIAVVLWVIAINTWKFGIKYYSSTGS